MLLYQPDFRIVQGWFWKFKGLDPKYAPPSGIEEATFNVVMVAQDTAVKQLAPALKKIIPAGLAYVAQLIAKMVEVDESIILTAFKNRAGGPRFQQFLAVGQASPALGHCFFIFVRPLDKGN